MKEYGGPEVLEVAQRPEPVAQAGQVLVRVRAATVNPADLFTRSGALSALTGSLRLPVVLGWDFAGTLETDTGDLRAGQRVAGLVPWFQTAAGAYAERIAVDPAWIAPIPDAVDDVAAAAVPLNAMTARQALDLLGLAVGQSLLVTGASGAVGGYAVQLAAANGLVVTASASDGDEAYVSALGAKTVLGRLDVAGLIAAVRAAPPDGGFDAVPLGPATIGAVRDGGHFVTVLDPAVPAPERGVRVSKVSVEPGSDQLRRLLEAVAAGSLIPRVAETLPLEQAAQAHQRFAAGGLRGRIVLIL